MTALRVVIFGAGDFARVAARYLAIDSRHEIVAFSVHESSMPRTATLQGLPVVPFETLEDSQPSDSCAIFVAVGSSRLNRARAEIVAECGARGYALISYVNSRATCWGRPQIGANCFVFENTVIQPFVTIGDNVILCSGTHIGHDVTIGRHVFVGAHAVISGNCTIGDYSLVGANSTIRDGVTIAPRSVIRTGAVIVRDTQEGDVLAVPDTPPLPKRRWELDGF